MSKQAYQGYIIQCFGGRDCIDSEGVPYADDIKVFYHEEDMFPHEDIMSVIDAKRLIDELIKDATRLFYENLPDFGQTSNVIQFPVRQA